MFAISFNTFINNLEPKKEEEKSEGNNIKEEIIEKSDVIENIEKILTTEEPLIPEPEPEVKPEPEPEVKPLLVPDKEIISVNKISDNETVDEFFNDVSKIIEKKSDIRINKIPEKYTLFDDAAVKEN